MVSFTKFNRIDLNLPQHEDACDDEQEVEGGQGGQDDVRRVPAHLRPPQDDDADQVAAKTNLENHDVIRIVFEINKTMSPSQMFFPQKNHIPETLQR